MAIIYQTQFQGGRAGLDVDFPLSTPGNTNIRCISGRGINFGYAVTCANGNLLRQIAPYLTLSLQNITFRIQYGISGIPNDFSSGLPQIQGVIFLEFSDPIDENSSSTSSFEVFLAAKADGSIYIFIPSGRDRSLDLKTSSAPGVLTYDGRIYGIQVTLATNGLDTVTYNIVVNNVSVLSGIYHADPATWMCETFAVPTNAWVANVLDHVCAQRAYVSMFDVKVYNQLHTFETSLAEIQVEDIVNIIPYGPSNASPADMDNACTSIIPPPPELSGIYFINPTNTHDVYNTSENKIPDPTVRTAGIGE